MKTLTTLLVLAVATATAQTKINQSIPASGVTEVRVNFDYPELVKVSTWDKQEVLITGSVSINGGEHDDAFKLNASRQGNRIVISNDLNLKGLPQRISVKEGDRTIIFKSKAEFKKYQDEHGRVGNYNQGADLEIVLEIKIPVNMNTKVESTYGMVEVTDFKGPLQVLATYGGVDATLSEKNTGELVAETNYGHIYSNLTAHVDKGSVNEEEDFHTVLSIKPGTGPSYRFESPYGKVYLRKTEK